MGTYIHGSKMIKNGSAVVKDTGGMYAGCNYKKFLKMRVLLHEGSNHCCSRNALILPPRLNTGLLPLCHAETAKEVYVETTTLGE